MIRSIAKHPFWRFLLTGGVAALANILARAGFSLFMPFEYAVVAAFPVGLTTGFLLARLFVFEPSGTAYVAEYVRFTAVNLLALAIVWAVSVGLESVLFPILGFTWNAQLIAHTIGVLSPVAFSYYAHRVFTFRRA